MRTWCCHDAIASLKRYFTAEVVAEGAGCKISRWAHLHIYMARLLPLPDNSFPARYATPLPRVQWLIAGQGISRLYCAPFQIEFITTAQSVTRAISSPACQCRNSLYFRRHHVRRSAARVISSSFGAFAISLPPCTRQRRANDRALHARQTSGHIYGRHDIEA